MPSDIFLRKSVLLGQIEARLAGQNLRYLIAIFVSVKYIRSLLLNILLTKIKEMLVLSRPEDKSSKIKIILMYIS